MDSLTIVFACTPHPTSHCLPLPLTLHLRNACSSYYNYLGGSHPLSGAVAHSLSWPITSLLEAFKWGGIKEATTYLLCPNGEVAKTVAVLGLLTKPAGKCAIDLYYEDAAGGDIEHLPARTILKRRARYTN